MPLEKLLGSVKNNPALSGALSGAAGGALVSAFTKKKTARKLLKAGGLLAVGGVAWKAYQAYQANQATQPGQAAQAGAPWQAAPIELGLEQFEAVVDASAPDTSAALVIQAMIAAAHADEHLTSDEQKQIWQRAVEVGLPREALATLSDQLSQPMPVEYFAASADDMATRIDVYTASLLVIDETCDAGRTHLESLATQLELPAPLVAALHEAQTETV